MVGEEGPEVVTMPDPVHLCGDLTFRSKMLLQSSRCPECRLPRLHLVRGPYARTVSLAGQTPKFEVSETTYLLCDCGWSKPDQIGV